MKARAVWITLPLVILLLIGAWMMRPGAATIVPDSANFALAPRHPVTQEMWDKAMAQGGADAYDFRLTTSENEAFHLFDQLAKTPVVLIATKDGCPCSIESQPFFNQISAAYSGKVLFIGLIDADIPVAQLYKRGHETPYPIVCATTKEPFLANRFKQSVTVSLIGRDKKVKKVWPGYSASMLEELNAAAADAADVPPKPLSFEDAPKEMTSGCYFFEEDPDMKAL